MLRAALLSLDYITLMRQLLRELRYVYARRAHYDYVMISLMRRVERYGGEYVRAGACVMIRCYVIYARDDATMRVMLLRSADECYFGGARRQT